MKGFQVSIWWMVRFNCSAGPTRFGFNATSMGNGDPDGVIMPVVTMNRVLVVERMKLLLFCSRGSISIMTVPMVLLRLSLAAALTDAVKSLGGIIKLKDCGCRLRMFESEVNPTVNSSLRA